MIFDRFNITINHTLPMKYFLIVCLFLTTLNEVAFGQTLEWQPVKDKILSPWAEEVDPDNPLPEYPRPQMRRDNWVNLNGLWDFAILAKGNAQPTQFDGQVLVPFSIESALSGVGKTVGAENELWYTREFEVDRSMRRGKLLLHFGAVDWEAEVFVNGESAGVHQGGYDPFSFEINAYLQSGAKQNLTVRVWDPSDEGPQPRGKQQKEPKGIWYTPVTGIWQTVWLEAVPMEYISDIKNTPDLDNQLIKVKPTVKGAKTNQRLTVKLLGDGQVLDEKIIGVNSEAYMKIQEPNLWSPKNPYLYDIEVSLIEGNKTVDEVKGYSALRKVSMAPDADGIQRMLLNDEFLFQYGPLDQGWWPDGLYTAPTEEALIFDIAKTKEMGFNMIRKHVKVEPARWYYHCDTMGILVWQDMPSGDMGNRWEPKPGVIGKGTERDRTPESAAIYNKEWKAIMDAFHNFPSIIVWVPFNEAWGQFDTREVTEWTMAYDPSRLVNSASGGNFSPFGHIMDVHNYPDPVMPDPAIYGKDQLLVLGEYGGLGLPVEGHTWQEKDNWGYQTFKNKNELQERYSQLIRDLKPLIEKGLSAGVYTQTTDVEVEVNGLMTYDRKVIKFDPGFLNSKHLELYNLKIPMK
jgi:beta-galactosidase/beta-glucuronidase